MAWFASIACAAGVSCGLIGVHDLKVGHTSHEGCIGAAELTLEFVGLDKSKYRIFCEQRDPPVAK